MKLGLVLGYSGKRVSVDMGPILEAERLGFDSVWTQRPTAPTPSAPPPGCCRARRRSTSARASCRCRARTPACTAGTAITLSQLSGALHPGPRAVGPAGRRGLARRRVRQAADAHARVHRDHPQDRRARGARRVRRRDLSAALPGSGRDGLGKPLKSIVHPDPGLRILHGLHRAGGPALRRRDGGRRNPRVDESGALRPLREAVPGGLHAAGGGKSLRTSRSRRSRAWCSVTTSRAVACPSRACSRSTSGAWAPAARTSTTTTRADSATRRPLPASRISTRGQEARGAGGRAGLAGGRGRVGRAGRSDPGAPEGLARGRPGRATSAASSRPARRRRPCDFWPRSCSSENPWGIHKTQ